MNKARRKPDAESHHHIHYSDSTIDINFRYFSPKRSNDSSSIAGEERMQTISLSDPSAAK